MANTALPFALGAGAAALLAAGVYALRGAAAWQSEESKELDEQRQGEPNVSEENLNNYRLPFTAQEFNNLMRMQEEEAEREGARRRALLNSQQSNQSSVAVDDREDYRMSQRELKEWMDKTMSRNADVGERAREDLKTLDDLAAKIINLPEGDKRSLTCTQLYELHLKLFEVYAELENQYPQLLVDNVLDRINKSFNNVERYCRV